MKHFASLLTTATLALLASVAAFAQTASPTDSAAAPANPLTVYGFIDGYYGYDFKHAATNERPNFIFSHNRQNEFTINQALVGLRYDNGQVRGEVGLHAGTYPSANYAPEDPIIRNIYQAYAGFRPFRKAWLDVGVFSSHIGIESALSKNNWTLTRSLAAEGSPYYEAGAKLTYEAAPTLTLTALVLNGWQNIRENNQAKALGTQLQWQATPQLLINSSTFYGNEQPTGLVRRRRYFHDFYARYAATSRLSLALVFDVGKQDRPEPGARADTWYTGTALARYQLAEKWRIGGRLEYFSADHGVAILNATPTLTDPDFKVRAGSLTLDYLPTTNVAVRLEGRLFNSGRDFLTDRNGRPTKSYGNLTSSIALSF
ncbi:porin [Hymenobacter rubripertinctus]|uniref:Porin n=1 Tax=Hymenobacter rubripertinctus TaxID=2029981 RepID=A0A418QT66_9BACT|nr:porin [Hymenobacter rubripertinctus]RIY08303.1 porin [Hymenobacter rubripertinctus]